VCLPSLPPYLNSYPRPQPLPPPLLSFHRHALGEVPGLVHVAPLAHGHVIGQELHGMVRRTASRGARFWDDQAMVDFAGQIGIPLGADGDDDPVAGLDLLDIPRIFSRTLSLGAR